MTQRLEHGGLVFLCDDPIEVARARSLFTKEPGTIAWLQTQVRHGDVVYDIGANIGCYSLLAAQLGAMVYAFEPHPVTAAHLLRNIAVNMFDGRVIVVTVPLDEHRRVAPFTMQNLRPGSSHHQFGGDGELAAMMLGASIDQLRAYGLPKADLIKIDVDGNERQVLAGMRALLTDTTDDPSPRSVQVEMAPAHSEAIVTFMAGVGYTLDGRHFTQLGQQAIDGGADPAQITDNAVFTRAA